VFEDAKQALCSYHVRAAIQKGLQQRLLGTSEVKTSAYKAFEHFVQSVMYMPACTDEVATLAKAKEMMCKFREA
jgi:hypothetical protein